MYFKKKGENKYRKCSKCGITRNIEEVLECPICREMEVKGRAFRRREKKKNYTV